ncbi:tetratricopeptide repeat protein [candidate division KSB1 bacterium]|nr:tetratricopeptide repeat protein [candidate division KSB1 bacterium]
MNTLRVFKNFRVLTLSVFLLLSGCAYYNTFYNAKKAYREASKEREKRLRNQVVEISPEERENLRRSGQYNKLDVNKPTTTEMQNYQIAIEKASKVLEFHPDSKYVDDALMLLGQCFYHRREYGKAQRKFEELIEIFPNSEFISQARLDLAKTFIGLKEYDEAENKLREILANQEIDSDIQEEAAYELGGLYYEQAKYELAAEEYKKTADQADDELIQAMSFYRLGMCLFAMENYEPTPAILQKAVDMSPNEDFKSQAVYKLGEALSYVGDFETAIKTFSDLLSKEMNEKKLPMIKVKLADNLRFNGDYVESVKWYNEIIEMHPRTDASARSYFALAEIEEFVNQDLAKAQEYYELVRGEYANSLIAPTAQERADDIKAYLGLLDEIAVLEGRKVTRDSTQAGDEAENGENEGPKTDDAPIDLSADGMWINYAGRDRPPPKSLTILTEEDRFRSQNQIVQSQVEGVEGDSLAAAPLDSAALAAQKEKEKEQKKYTIAEKKLALAELLLFNFDKADSAVHVYLDILETTTDSTMAARALYSLGYTFDSVLRDRQIADSVFLRLVELYPHSRHAEGARHILGFEIEDKVDSAKISFELAESMYREQNDFDAAIELYKKLIKRYPDSEYARKALLNMGWIYENELYQYEKAIDIYQSLMELDAKSSYAKLVQPKLAAVEKAQKEKEAREKAIADSLKRAAEQDSVLLAGGADSLATLPADSMALASGSDSLQTQAISDSGNVAQKSVDPPGGARETSSDLTPEQLSAAEAALSDSLAAGGQDKSLPEKVERVTDKDSRETPVPQKLEPEKAVPDRQESAEPDTSDAPAQIPELR